MNADEYLASLKIPNPLRPGSCFRNMDDLDEYAHQLWIADAEYRAKHQGLSIQDIINNDESFQLFQLDLAGKNSFHYMSIDEHIAKLRIPNPYRHGCYFNCLQELGDYASRLRESNAKSQNEGRVWIEGENMDMGKENSSFLNDESGYLIVDKSTGEVVAEAERNPFDASMRTESPELKSSSKSHFLTMRRIISWFVLLITARIVYALGYGVIAIFLFFLDWLGKKSRGIAIFFSWIAGGIGIGIMILPFTLGIPTIIRCAETVCESRTGLRYRVYSIVEIAIAVLLLISCLLGFEFRWQYVFLLIFSVVFFFSYKSCLGDTYN